MSWRSHNGCVNLEVECQWLTWGSEHHEPYNYVLTLLPLLSSFIYSFCMDVIMFSIYI